MIIYLETLKCICQNTSVISKAKATTVHLHMKGTEFFVITQFNKSEPDCMEFRE